MSAVAEWASRVAGDGCPLNDPRPDSNDHWDLVARLTVSSLYLSKNQTYRGQCQLIWQVPLETMPDTRLPDAERTRLIAALREALFQRVS